MHRHPDLIKPLQIDTYVSQCSAVQGERVHHTAAFKHPCLDVFSLSILCRPHAGSVHLAFFLIQLFADLSDTVRGLDAMIVEREEYEEVVLKWLCAWHV